MASQSISVPISDDATYEGNVTLNLYLANPLGATLGSPASAVLTIIENDPVPPAGSLQFGSATYSVDESGPNVLISVTRTGGSFGAVSVDYASSNGTASAGSDYTAVAGTLSFADGVATSQSFSVPISEDTLFEGNETVNLTLSNVTGGASLGTPGTAILTITENDQAPPPDSNNDGLSDADALALGLDPNDPDGDSDNDGLSDVDELGGDPSNPLSLDNDGDGIIDALEPGSSASDLSLIHI